MSFSFALQSTYKHARTGIFHTDHGSVATPIFMPVGTRATIKALDQQDIEQLEAQIILANTYHLFLRPGMDRLERLGGIHRFMSWDKPILTDSGGFQVFSLGNQATSEGRESQVKITSDGVTFRSHLDGTKHTFTPERAIEIQRTIGADIIMAFDECTPDQATQQYAAEALDRTHRWAEQCYQYWEEQGRQSRYGHYQALFGIVQGAMHPEMRRESAEYMASLDFDGIAVGGETVGYNMGGTGEVMDWIRDLLPVDKPRYAMGLGRDPENLVDAVKMGFDMFDCVAPTRLARNGTIYYGSLRVTADDFYFESPYAKGRLQIGNAQFAEDTGVLQEGCDCYTCTSGYTRAYLHHLYRLSELAYYRLASIHNVRFMVRLSQSIRAAVEQLAA